MKVQSIRQIAAMGAAALFGLDAFAAATLVNKMLGRHVKSIDNALQRVKRKLFKYLEDHNKA